ncbi:rod shape-determining protein MreC [endosymbiont of Ridgeia piscesae]|nr:rod shape-determining protein MreC [endosymbiont of Ridgeia piscesae]
MPHPRGSPTIKPIFTQGLSLNTRLFSAVLLSIILMVLDHREKHLDELRSALSVLIYPIQYIASLPTQLARQGAESLADRDQLNQDRQRLAKQNLELRARLQKFEALEAENMRLRGLLDSSFKVGDRVLISELLAVEQDPFRQLVVIDKGSTSGAFKGQPVLDANAVAGQITLVTPYTSTVLLITDANHALPVQVNRNGLRTIAMGTGLINQLQLPHLPNNADIKPGDLLVTSGLAGRFPPGYPVAEVTSVVREPGKPFASVTARPTADLDRIREVLLVWTLTPKTLQEQPSADEVTQ